MSLRPLSMVTLLAWVAACGGDGNEADEPQTARDKLRAEETKDKKGKGDDDDDEASTRPRGKWRYSGERDSCFFRVGQKCFKTQAAACSAAKCAKSKCESEGAAPAQVSCKK